LVFELAPSSANRDRSSRGRDGLTIMVPSALAHSLIGHESGQIARADPPSLHRGGSCSTSADDEGARADRLQALAAYERAWARPDEDTIGAELARCWTARSTHVSSFTDTVVGFHGLTQLILDFPVMFPGAVFRMTSVPDVHHDVARFGWLLRSTRSIRILGRDFGSSVRGLDYVEFDSENLIRRVIAFFGPLAILSPDNTPTA
jgi:hypothetical protein